MIPIQSLSSQIRSIPLGHSKYQWKGRLYSVTRTDFNNGGSTKVFAEQLGGNDFISFNYYFTLKKANLKPCEMPEDKVVDFILNSLRCEQEDLN